MNQVAGIVVRGHGVASGKNGDPRFPGGTIAMQLPFFASRGLNLSTYYPATINLSIAPAKFRPGKAFATFTGLKWHPQEPAEDFSFFECTLRLPETTGEIHGLIYYPHPETKPEHFQAPDTLEVLASQFVEGLEYGSRVLLSAPPAQIVFQE